MSCTKFVDNTLESQNLDDTANSSTAAPTVHYLPFRVDFEGTAKVQEMFTDCIESHPDIDNVKTNYFRSRPLTGMEMSMDSNYTGYVASNLKTKVSTAQSDDKTIQLTKRFDTITYWNWDKVPSSMDSPAKLQDWLKLSQIMHEPIVPAK